METILTDDSTSPVLMFSGHCFRFNSSEAAEKFLTVMFGASRNRAALYREMILSTTESMLEEIFQDITPAEKVMGAIILSGKYGAIYDPESKLFSSKDPSKSISSKE